MSQSNTHNIKLAGFSHGDLFPKDMAQWPSMIEKVDPELIHIADEIEKSDGLALMLNGGARQMGIKKTVLIIAAIRKAAGAKP